ncbi:MAG: glycerol-3-phosphate 1-O-acyltransferase PlsY [Eggerthellaceae bacterium]|jgi:glycerol-3-phosphate acyltransferase PlsY
MPVVSSAALVSVFLIGFLLGSIPWGVVVGKVFFHRDIREVGSGNIGTTNAMRALGHRGGAAVFLLDFGKGIVSGLLALAIANAAASGGMFAGTVATREECLALSFFACIIGHVFSPWLKFHGGKGIAVGIGAMFVVFGPVVALIEIALFAVLVIISKYVSLGSIAAAVLCLFFSFYCFWGDWAACWLCFFAAAIVIWSHRENIRRLATGTERRIGENKEV